MDINLYKERCPLLLQILRERGYSAQWIYKYSSECNKIISEGEHLSSIDDYILQVQKQSVNGVVAWVRITVIRAIQLFVQDNVTPIHIKKKSTYSLTPYYDSILNYGIMVAKRKGLNEKTCQNYLDTVTTFFLHLETNNVMSLGAVSEDVVLSYFNGEIKRGHTTSRLIIRFIGLVKGFIGDEIAQKLDTLIPRVQKYHRVYRGLTEVERQKVELVLLNGHNSLTFKDRAICALAFYTGLRACDIINLRFSNIDWHRNLISLIQVKTHKEIQLRLLPSYGNLIYDYITKERSKSRDSHIFLRMQGGSMNTHDTYRCTIKVLHAAGLNIEGLKRGIHLLRHSLATALIAKNTNYAIVTATLGHKSAKATYTYLSSETESLRKCALSSNKFSINNDFFQL